MATEKHKTILEIAVEDRLLRRFGDTMKRVFSTEPIDRHARAQAKVTQEIEKQQRAAEKAAGAPGGKAPVGRAPGARRDPRTGQYIPGSGGGSGGGGSGGGGAGGSGGGGGRQPLGFGGTAMATGVGFMGGQMMGRGMGAMQGMARGTGSTAAALNAIPVVGPALAAAVQAAEGLTDTAIGAATARQMTMGQTGVGKTGGMGMAKYGISRQQLPGRLAQLAGQSGMRGDDLAQMAPDALRTETLTGVSGGLMAGAAGTSGGQVSPESAHTMTMDAISAGMDAGFRDAKLGQFVQSIASDIEQMRSRGIMIDTNALPSMARMFGQSGREGLQGEAGLHAAKTMTQAVQGAGDRNDFYGALAIQTAMDTGLSHHDAAMALEKDPHKFMPQILERIGSMGGSTEAKAMAIRKFMPNLSRRAAFSMAQGAEGGDLTSAEGGGALGNVRKWAEEQGFGGAFGGAEDYVDQQEGNVSGLAGAAAGLQNKQIAGGEAVAGSMMKTRGREVKLAKRGAKIGSEVAEFTSGIIEKYGDALASKDPIGAIFTQLGKDAGALFGALAKKVQEAVDEVTKKIFGTSTTDAAKEVMNASPDELAGAFKLALQDLIDFLREMFAKIPGIGHLLASNSAGGTKQLKAHA